MRILLGTLQHWSDSLTAGDKSAYDFSSFAKVPPMNFEFEAQEGALRNSAFQPDPQLETDQTDSAREMEMKSVSGSTRSSVSSPAEEDSWLPDLIQVDIGDAKSVSLPADKLPLSLTGCLFLASTEPDLCKILLEFNGFEIIFRVMKRMQEVTPLINSCTCTTTLGLH